MTFRSTHVCEYLLIAAGVVAGVMGVVVLSGARNLRAQSPAANPSFEVASIKQNKSGDGSVRLGIQPGGRFTATNVPLRELIRSAYQVQNFHVVGAPDWAVTDRWDIQAKAEGEVPPSPPGTVGPMQLMMRSLLADRFKLVVHTDKREMPVYVLALNRADGRLGTQLTVSTFDCQAMVNAAMSRGGAAAAPPPTTPSGRPTCGMRTGGGQIMAGGFPMSQLASALAGMLQRTVVDRTGLKGLYDLELTFAPLPQAGGPGGGAPPPADDNRPSIFTAVQEQLGLKLDSQRDQVDVLVIDKVERPVED